MFSNDWLGDFDGSKDEYLFDCFVDTPAHADALDGKIFAIRAFKGSGKTAFIRKIRRCSKNSCADKGSCKLERKFCEINGNYIVIPVDVRQISFEMIFQLSKSQNDPRIDIANILRDIIKLYSVVKIKEAFAKREDCTDQSARLEKYFKSQEIAKHSKNLLKSVLVDIEKFATKNDAVATTIAGIFLKEGSTLDDLCRACYEALKESNTIALIMLDKFDVIIDLFKHGEKDRFYYHQTIAASLIELAYNDEDPEDMHEFEFPNRKMQLKIFFPEDLFLLLNMRDMQKYNTRIMQLKWSRDDLYDLTSRRILHFLKKNGMKNLDKGETFQKVFPKKIRNTTFNADEDVFDYIIRHTFFRPRDILQLCSEIFSEFIRKQKITNQEEFINALPVDEQSIKDGVKAGSSDIAKYLLIEFETSDLEKALNAIRKKSHVVEYSVLYSSLNKVFDYERKDIKDIINTLYKIGCIGVIRSGNPKVPETYSSRKSVRNGNIEYVSLFSYSWNGNVNVEDSDTIAISPVLYDPLEIKPNDYGIVHNF